MTLSVWHAKMRTPKVELLGGSTKQLGDSIAICPAATIYIYHLGIQIAQIAQHLHGAFSDRFGIGQSHWWMELSHGSMACNSAQGQKGQKGQTECDKVLLGTASVDFRGAIFGFSDFSSKLRADGHEFWPSTGAAG